MKLYRPLLHSPRAILCQKLTTVDMSHETGLIKVIYMEAKHNGRIYGLPSHTDYQYRIDICVRASIIQLNST